MYSGGLSSPVYSPVAPPPPGGDDVIPDDVMAVVVVVLTKPPSMCRLWMWISSPTLITAGTSLVLAAAVDAVAGVVAAVVAGSARGDFAVFIFGEEIDAAPENKVRFVSIFIYCSSAGGMTSPLAYPGFPRWAPTHQWAPTYHFAKFCEKLHEIERTRTPSARGARPEFTV